MFTLKDIAVLYWANIKSFWRNSFRIYESDDHTEVGPFPRWFFELIFFIPSIVVIPIIKTIIDFVTRKPLSQDDDLQIQHKMDALQDMDLLEFTIKKIIQAQTLYQSQNSKNLISALGLLQSEKINGRYMSVPRQTTFSPTDAPEMQRANRTLEEVLAQLGITVEDFLASGQTPLSPQFEALTEEEKQAHLIKQWKAVKDYMQNSENKGAKLMQYIQINLSEPMQRDNRETTLKVKAQMEIDRLDKQGSSSSKSKAEAIRNTISPGKSFDEGALRQALLIHRGFFKHMPDAYAHVFCEEHTMSNSRQWYI